MKFENHLKTGALILYALFTVPMKMEVWRGVNFDFDFLHVNLKKSKSSEGTYFMGLKEAAC